MRPALAARVLSRHPALGARPLHRQFLLQLLVDATRCQRCGIGADDRAGAAHVVVPEEEPPTRACSGGESERGELAAGEIIRRRLPRPPRRAYVARRTAVSP